MEFAVSTSRLLSSLFAATALAALPLAAPVSAHTYPGAHQEEQAGAAYARLPMAFELNSGQTDAQVDFLSHGAGYTVFLSRGEAVLDLGAETALRLEVIGANAEPLATGSDQLEGRVNYLRGSDPSAWQYGHPDLRASRLRECVPRHRPGLLRAAGAPGI